MNTITTLPDLSSIFFNAIIRATTSPGTKLDTAYIEFVNGDAIEKPNYDSSQMHDYFRQLGSSPDRDYLRVPITAHNINRNETTGLTSLVVFASTDGETGVHGKPFSAAVGSRVYGITLAASQGNDRGDLLALTCYYSPEDQPLKPENSEIMVQVTLT